tara:strand:+ start:691 stop:2070 length:1380 start_codon:yes stop_codon:yes gene_type:complete
MSKDEIFLNELKRLYQDVLKSPPHFTAEKIRENCSINFLKALEKLNLIFKGSENLPYEKNSIFIYNHLFNHPYLEVDDGFQITLDSHFVSSKILYKYYRNPGFRVTRFSLEKEINHKKYYDRLGYTKVYSKDFTPNTVTKEKIKRKNKDFYVKAKEQILNGLGLAFSPEGNSYSTEKSPGIFKNGIFKLAASFEEQPKIVPIVMANFDKLPSEATFKCEIKPPFKISDYGITDRDDPNLSAVIKSINDDYAKWVYDLRKEKPFFRNEIDVLKKQIKKRGKESDLFVFYGSSTIRLWHHLKSDFKHLNILNLGFGGAYISSISKYFADLTAINQPKSIVLYLGGNDLTLDISDDSIIKKTQEIIIGINCKFPNAIIFNISIKPSLERINQMDSILKINKHMTNFCKKNSFVNQVDLFDELIVGGKISKEYFLQDGLHLNSLGYKKLKSVLNKNFNKHNLI